MREFAPALRSRIKSPENDQKKEAYQKAYASLNAVLASIPFMHVPAIGTLVKDALIDNERVFSNSGFTPDKKTEFMNSLSRAFETGKGQVQVELEKLRAPQLNRSQKESLAQDRDLVESVRVKNEPISSAYMAAACRVDEAYGKGAEYRDYVFIGTSIVLDLWWAS